jgi:hypothetical protein
MKIREFELAAARLVDSAGGQTFLRRFRIVLLPMFLGVAVYFTLLDPLRDRHSYLSGTEVNAWNSAVWLLCAAVIGFTFFPRTYIRRLICFLVCIACLFNLRLSDEPDRAIWLPLYCLVAWLIVAAAQWAIRPLRRG